MRRLYSFRKIYKLRKYFPIGFGGKLTAYEVPHDKIQPLSSSDNTILNLNAVFACASLLVHEQSLNSTRIDLNKNNSVYYMVMGVLP